MGRTIGGKALLLSSAMLGLAILGCPRQQETTPQSHTSAQVLTVKYLDQGWTDKVRKRFHYESQGSELIPYYWFLNLLEPDGKKLFKDDLVKYGMLYDPTLPDADLNPDNLPIGFARQDEKATINGVSEPHWLGLTCAACHTGAFTYKPDKPGALLTTYIIDGAPSSSDLGTFFQDLGKAVQATANDPAKLEALAKRVLEKHDGKSVEEISARFKSFSTELSKIVELATPTNPWGSGRVDAFGVIFNRACDYDNPGVVEPFSPPDAPVSFPFLWYSGRQDHIQWHGEVPNQDWVSRFGRNTGEVIGVFARVDVKPGALKYKGSINPKGLGQLDEYIEDLKAPVWAEVFGQPDEKDQVLINKGRELFKANCGTGWCHHDVAAKGGMLAVRPTPLLPGLNTDDTMTKLVHTRSAPTGELAGHLSLIIAGTKFGSTAPADQIVVNVAAGGLLDKKAEVISAFADHVISKLIHPAGQSKAEADTGVSNAKSTANVAVTDQKLVSAYKIKDTNVTGKAAGAGYDPTKDGYESRPLAGIWATAPYLHNGSVPNLFELLWPNKREDRFYVGALAYDTKNVGYICDGTAGGQPFNTKLKGNSNSGHTYGSTLSEDDRWAIIEYLKRL